MSFPASVHDLMLADAQGGRQARDDLLRGLGEIVTRVYRGRIQPGCNIGYSQEYTQAIVSSPIGLFLTSEKNTDGRAHVADMRGSAEGQCFRHMLSALLNGYPIQEGTAPGNPDFCRLVSSQEVNLLLRNANALLTYIHSENNGVFTAPPPNFPGFANLAALLSPPPQPQPMMQPPQQPQFVPQQQPMMQPQQQPQFVPQQQPMPPQQAQFVPQTSTGGWGGGGAADSTSHTPPVAPLAGGGFVSHQFYTAAPVQGRYTPTHQEYGFGKISADLGRFSGGVTGIYCERAPNTTGVVIDCHTLPSAQSVSSYVRGKGFTVNDYPTGSQPSAKLYMNPKDFDGLRSLLFEESGRLAELSAQPPSSRPGPPMR